MKTNPTETRQDLDRIVEEITSSVEQRALEGAAAETLNELIEALSRAQELAAALATSDEPTEDQEAEVTEAEDEVRSIYKRYKAALKADRAKANIDQLRAHLAHPQPRLGAPVEHRSTAKPVTRTDRPRIEIPYGTAPTAFKRAMPHATTPELREIAYAFGRFVQATSRMVRPEIREDASRWCREHRAMVGDDNAKGGYLVPDMIRPIILALEYEYGVARQAIGDVATMLSDTELRPKKVGNVTVYFPDQGGTITASDLSLGTVTLNAKKAAALTTVAREILASGDADAVIDIANTVVDGIALGFAEKEDWSVFVGTSNAAFGVNGVITQLLDSVGGAKKGLVEAVETSIDALSMKSITKLTGKLPNFKGLNKAFFAQKEVAEQVFTRLETGYGAFAGDPNRRTFLGYPVYYVNDMPAAPSSSDVAILFGDLGAAVAMGQRREMEIADSEHFLFGNDLVAIRGTERVGLNVHGVGDASAAGAIVGLKLKAGGG